MAEKIMTIGDICQKALQALEGYEVPSVPPAERAPPAGLAASLEVCRGTDDVSAALLVYLIVQALEEPAGVREAVRHWLGSTGEGSKGEGGRGSG